MGCCGGKREQFHTQALSSQSYINTEPDQAMSPSPRPILSNVVYFQYLGKTGLTATGPITGRRYRFDGPGAVASVDERDAPSITAIPNLKRVKNPQATS